MQKEILPRGQCTAQCSDTKYLGVTITNEGITDIEMRERIKSATLRIGQMKSCSMLRQWHSLRSEKLLITLIKTLYEYMMHLMPPSLLTKQEINDIERITHNPPVRLKQINGLIDSDLFMAYRM